MQEIQEFFSRMFPQVEPSLLAPMFVNAEPRHFAKKELFCAQGETPEVILFIQHGIFRGYFCNQKGDEMTDCFCYRHGEMPVPNLPLDAPASINMEALAESDTITLPVEDVVQFLETNDFALRIYNNLLIDSLRRHIEVKKMLYQVEAAKRYAWFLEHYPDLDPLVNDKYIASFLGVTPVTLSRARSALGRKKRSGTKP